MSLNTFDSNTNSIDVLKKNKIIPPKTSIYDIINKIYRGYLLMKIRMKLSYCGCRHGRTVLEHYLKAIMLTYT